MLRRGNRRVDLGVGGGVNQNVSWGRGSAVAEAGVQVCEGAVSSWSRPIGGVWKETCSAGASASRASAHAPCEEHRLLSSVRLCMHKQTFITIMSFYKRQGRAYLFNFSSRPTVTYRDKLIIITFKGWLNVVRGWWGINNTGELLSITTFFHCCLQWHIKGAYREGKWFDFRTMLAD